MDCSDRKFMCTTPRISQNNEAKLLLAEKVVFAVFDFRDEGYYHCIDALLPPGIK